MKFTTSADGTDRTSVQVIVRLTRIEVAALRAFLKGNGEPSNDSAVRDLVRNLTEYIPTETISELTELMDNAGN